MYSHRSTYIYTWIIGGEETRRWELKEVTLHKTRVEEHTHKLQAHVSELRAEVCYAARREYAY